MQKKTIKHKENNKTKDLNHKISRAIVNSAAQQACGIKMERLSDIRTTAHQSRPSRPALHSWSFYQLQTMMEYKAKLLGVPVAYVNPAYTSQQCSRCGMVSEIKKYFLKEREEEIGDLAAGLLLNFITERIAPEFYNKGVNDAYGYMSERLEEMLGIQK